VRLLASQAGPVGPDTVTAAGSAFDPFDPQFVLNPYPALRELQKDEPVFFAPAINSWIVTRYDTVRSVLQDAKRFSASITSDPLTPLCPQARRMIVESDFDVPALLVNNSTDSHPRCRKFFGEPLKPQRLKQLHSFIEDTTDALIAAMVAQGPPSDLATGLTWDLPALTLFRLLGVPDAEVPMVKAYADSRVVLLWGRPSEDDQIRLTRSALDFFHYTKQLVQDRLRNPREDYPSDLIRARDGDDERATLPEIIGVTFNLLFAGHETTSSAMANTLSAVLGQPGLWTDIAEGRADVPKLVDEGLRYDPPVQAWRRLAVCDVTLEGVDIPAGGQILLHFGAANRDGRVFEHPETFDPGRGNSLHVSFGVGAHFCLGASLARAEMAIAIERLARRLPGLAILPDNLPSYLPNTSFRGLRQLRVAW
jgi:cytochrome P450